MPFGPPGGVWGRILGLWGTLSVVLALGGVLGATFGSLWRTFGDLLRLFGAPWCVLQATLGPFGSPLEGFWHLVASLGTLFA